MIWLSFFIFLRFDMGTCVLGAGFGTRVWGFEAWLLLPNASLLHKRRGAEPGESLDISTRAHAVACTDFRFHLRIQRVWIFTVYLHLRYIFKRITDLYINAKNPVYIKLSFRLNYLNTIVKVAIGLFSGYLVTFVLVIFMLICFNFLMTFV